MTETEINFWLIRLGLLACAIKDQADDSLLMTNIKELANANLAIISDLVHIIEYKDRDKLQTLQEKWRNLPQINGVKIL